MKKFLSSLALLTVLAVMPANAQLVKFGLKGGMNRSSMSFDEKDISSDGRVGWFIGPSAKLSLPVLPVGFDIAALYDQKETKVNDKSIKQQNILIPVNVRGNFGIGSTASIYVAAGPQFGFNVGDDNFSWKSVKADAENTFQLKKSSFSINVGAGVSVLKHIEVGFAYNIPIGTTGDLQLKDATDAAKNIIDDTKVNTWTISAAYYF